MENLRIFNEKDFTIVLDWIKSHKPVNQYRRGGSSVKLLFNQDEMIFSSKNFAIVWLSQNKSKCIGKEVSRIAVL